MKWLSSHNSNLCKGLNEISFFSEKLWMNNDIQKISKVLADHTTVYGNSESSISIWGHPSTTTWSQVTKMCFWILSSFGLQKARSSYQGFLHYSQDWDRHHGRSQCSKK